MNEALEKEARKKVRAKMTFYTCAIVFSSVAVILLILSLYLSSIAFWLLLPIPVLLMVLALTYFLAFGFPFSEVGSADWQENEVEREMIRLYRKQRQGELPPLEDQTDREKLELEDLQPAAEKISRDEDYV